jgi:MFS family permease
VLGYTQAFSSIGGIMATGSFALCVRYAAQLPAISGAHAAWRYTLISGLIPAIPLILIRPFLPESPAWREKRARGTLKRPSILELFRPAFRRTTLLTSLLFACGYGAAFGVLQWTPQMVPGLVPGLAALPKLRAELDKAEPGSPQYEQIKKKIEPLNREQQANVAGVQIWQELGGLLGRFALAWLAIRIVSRRALLWIFLLPGLIVIPLVYGTAAAGNLGTSSLEVLKYGIFVCGFFTVAQLSFWGNYLPRVYPTYLRGTGEGFAANVGGRMFGTAANPVTGFLQGLLALHVAGLSRPTSLAYAATIVGAAVYLIGSVACYWLPEPGKEELPE